jgi:hypothetical protein
MDVPSAAPVTISGVSGLPNDSIPQPSVEQSILPESGLVVNPQLEYPPVAKDIIHALDNLPPRDPNGNHIAAEVIRWRDFVEREIVSSLYKIHYYHSGSSH